MTNRSLTTEPVKENHLVKLNRKLRESALDGIWGSNLLESTNTSHEALLSGNEVNSAAVGVVFFGIAMFFSSNGDNINK